MAKIKIGRELKVGLFALITLAALWWGMSFLKGSDLFNTNNVYYAMYDQVNGVQKAAAITIKGYKVGVISDITFDPAKSSKIILHFSIKSRYDIPEDSYARIYSDGLLGGKAVEIELGNSDSYLASGDTLRASMDKDILDIAGSELEFLKQTVGTLATNMNAALANMNKIMEANAGSLSATLGNIAEMSESLKDVVKSEEGDLRAIIANMNTLSATLRDNSGKIDRIVTNFENFSDSLSSAEIPTLIASLSGSLEELNATLGTVNREEGTLGKMVGDPALYDSLVTASSNLSLLLEDLRENPKRYVHFSVFGRKDKEKDKKTDNPE
jgi:phospholipid/cholesterol/gamma-HCH transport system substrate-binding protein